MPSMIPRNAPFSCLERTLSWLGDLAMMTLAELKSLVIGVDIVKPCLVSGEKDDWGEGAMPKLYSQEFGVRKISQGQRVFSRKALELQNISLRSSVGCVLAAFGS